MNYDKSKWKVYTWKNFLMLHWIINPGLTVNELFFGQRVPKVTLEDKLSNKPRIERSFVPCPHCKTLHDSRIWSTQNNRAFMNWFGLYCRSCGSVIPCLINITSFLILAVTFPLWVWFKTPLKNMWLKKQPARFKNINPEIIPNPFEGLGWIQQGVSFGIFMFVFMGILYPLMSNGHITQKEILIGIPVWIIGGLGFGFSMKLYSNKKGRITTNKHVDDTISADSEG